MFNEKDFITYLKSFEKFNNNHSNVNYFSFRTGPNKGMTFGGHYMKLGFYAQKRFGIPTKYKYVEWWMEPRRKYNKLDEDNYRTFQFLKTKPLEE